MKRRVEKFWKAWRRNGQKARKQNKIELIKQPHPNAWEGVAFESGRH